MRQEQNVGAAGGAAGLKVLEVTTVWPTRTAINCSASLRASASSRSHDGGWYSWRGSGRVVPTARAQVLPAHPGRRVHRLRLPFLSTCLSLHPDDLLGSDGPGPRRLSGQVGPANVRPGPWVGRSGRGGAQGDLICTPQPVIADQSPPSRGGNAHCRSLSFRALVTSIPVAC
jgi:hypothetical protein